MITLPELQTALAEGIISTEEYLTMREYTIEVQNLQRDQKS